MIDRHWDGIAAYCQTENKVALGFVEGLNNKVRVLQRRAYGLRDEESNAGQPLWCFSPSAALGRSEILIAEIPELGDRPPPLHVVDVGSPGALLTGVTPG